MTPYFIRPARPEDADDIVRFNLAMALESEGLHLDPASLHRGVRRSLADPDRGVYFMAEESDHLLGQIRVTKEWSDWNNGYYWWIQNVYVEPASRRRGVYAALHAHVRDLAQEAGACGLQLYVDRENRLAQSVYSRLGMGPSNYLFFEQKQNAAPDAD